MLERRYRETRRRRPAREVDAFMTERAVPGVRRLAAAARVARGQDRRASRSPTSCADRSRRRAVFFDGLSLTEREATIARRVLKEIRERLGFLMNVGLDYLTLDRPAATLSGGEGAAHPAGHADRLEPGGRPVYPG